MPQRRFQIHVTEGDIANGLRNNSYHCAVSCAIARQIPDAKYVSTDIQTIRFSLAEAGERVTYLTPPDVQQYVIAFDAGDVLRPFTFTLNMPAWRSSRYPSRAGIPRENSRAHPTDEIARINTGHGVVEVPRSKRAAPRMVASGRRIYGLRAMRVNAAG